MFRLVQSAGALVLGRLPASERRDAPPSSPRQPQGAGANGAPTGARAPDAPDAALAPPSAEAPPPVTTALPRPPADARHPAAGRGRAATSPTPHRQGHPGRAQSLVPVAWPWPTGAVADGRPQLTKVALPRSEGGARAPSYLLAPGPDGVALRVGPSRLGGSSAKVRWALDAAGRPVAVHCSRRPPTSFGPTSRERLEGAAYVSLHPDVVPRDAFVDRKGRRVLVMPLWETDLFALEATLCKSDDVRRAVGRKLLRDLAENYVRLHARGIVHNDCKPENVLVRRDGTFALTDVDCAFVERRTAPKSWRTALVATPSFPAPEPLREPLDATRAVDVFRLGLCLLSLYGSGAYALFAGETNPARDAAGRRAQALQNLGLVQRLRRQRAGLPLRPLGSLVHRRRFLALKWLSDEFARIDAALHALVVERMLAEDPLERPCAAALSAAAAELLPTGSAEAGRACAAVAEACEGLAEVKQQRRDLARLAALPPRPPQP